MMVNIPESMIKTMSYETRQRNFNQEKDELLWEMRGATAQELTEALQRLIKKWKV